MSTLRNIGACGRSLERYSRNILLCNACSRPIWHVTVKEDMVLSYFVGHAESLHHLIRLEILVTQLSAGMWLSSGDQCIWPHWWILSSTKEKLPEALLLGEVAKGWDWYGESTAGNMRYVVPLTFLCRLAYWLNLYSMCEILLFTRSSFCLGVCKDFVTSAKILG